MKGYNCAQAVLYSFCEHLSFEKTTACKIACGFVAGMGRKEEVCGAVSGGIMAIGLRHGRVEEDNITATELTYKKTRELMDRFVGRHGTLVCRALLNDCDLRTEEGQKQFKENDLLAQDQN